MEFKEFNCTQWTASVTFCGNDLKLVNCDRIYQIANCPLFGICLKYGVTCTFLRDFIHQSTIAIRNLWDNVENQLCNL